MLSADSERNQCRDYSTLSSLSRRFFGIRHGRHGNQYTMDQSPNQKPDTLPLTRLRQFVSMGALLLALAHIIWPQLAIDAIALALIVIAILPWLAPLVKSLELPGGWKVEFQDLQKAASRAESAGLLAAAPLDKEATFSFQSIANRDPNLALAGLRIEIEKRLSSLAEIHGLNSRRPMGVGQALRALAQAEVLTNEERSILADMVNLLNSAVHGAEVDSRAAAWAIDVGPRLLTSLDERVSEAQRLINDSTGPAQKVA
jgi:hypothetical protein